jgi:fatty acid desaturase
MAGAEGAAVAVGWGGVVAVGAAASVAAGTAVAGAAAGGWVAAGAGAGAAVAAGWQAVKSMLAKTIMVTTTITKRCFTFSSFKEYVFVPNWGKRIKESQIILILPEHLLSIFVVFGYVKPSL